MASRPDTYVCIFAEWAKDDLEESVCFHPGAASVRDWSRKDLLELLQLLHSQPRLILRRTMPFHPKTQLCQCIYSGLGIVSNRSPQLGIAPKRTAFPQGGTPIRRPVYCKFHSRTRMRRRAGTASQVSRRKVAVVPAPWRLAMNLFGDDADGAVMPSGCE